MPEIPRISRLILSRFRQFGYCDIDLTHPDTGEALPRVCLLGPNGVGKSTVLDLLYRNLAPGDSNGAAPVSSDALVLAGFTVAGETLYRATDGSDLRNAVWFGGDIETSSKWASLENNPPDLSEFIERFSEYALSVAPEITPGSLALFTPETNLVDDHPVGGFREFLETREAERQNEYHQFLKHPDNRDRTIAEVDAEFAASFPNVLEAIREIWKPILSAAFLEFRPEAEEPLTSTQTGDEISFSALSPGLRQHLLRLAHVYAQYFHRDEQGGFLFLDDADTGLNPDLARMQMQFFHELFENRPGQIIATTHSPRVASLFSSEERIQLQFDEERGVSTLDRIVQKASDSDADPEPESEIEETMVETKTERAPVSAGKLAAIRRAMEETEDQDELADLLDEMMTLRRQR